MIKLKKYALPAIALLVIVGVITTALLIGDDSSKPKAKIQAQQSACGPYRSDKDINISKQQFQTEVVKNNAESAAGLGGRPCILPNQAMLFPFARAGIIPIWMKGMKFPIDIIWIDADHKIVAMEIDESPKTYPDKFENKAPAQYVLEIKANRVRELNLQLGSVINF